MKYTVTVDGKKYTLTSGRKVRDLREEGIVEDEKLLAAYDKREGAIFDEKGKKVENGKFSENWEFDEESYVPRSGGKRTVGKGHVPQSKKTAKKTEKKSE